MDDPKSMIKEFQYGPMEKALRILRRPTSFVIIILVCVIMLVTMQFGHMQHEIAMLSKRVKETEKDEKRISSKISTMNSQLRHVQREEDELKRKEVKLEKRENELEKEAHAHKKDSWGEDPSEVPHIQIVPLVPHITPSPQLGINRLFGGLHEMLQ